MQFIFQVVLLHFESLTSPDQSVQCVLGFDILLVEDGMFLIGDHSIEVVDLASGLDADWVLPIFINALLIHIQLQDSIDAIFANDPDHVFLLKYHP